LNYDGLTSLLEIYEKVSNIDRQLLKAEMKIFKVDATVLNILNPVMGSLETLSRLDTVSRQYVHCLGLGLGLECI